MFPIFCDRVPIKYRRIYFQVVRGEVSFFEATSFFEVEVASFFEVTSFLR